MVKNTRKNKLGGKKMRNKKVSSRKYKKGGNHGNYGNYCSFDDFYKFYP